MKKKIIVLILALAAILSFSLGCKKPQEEVPSEEPAFVISGRPSGDKADLSAKTLTLSVPSYYQNKSPRWSSTDEGVAEIGAETGLVDLKSSGETTISVRLKDDASKKASFVLTVTGGSSGDDGDKETHVYAETVSIISPREQISLKEKSFSLSAQFDKDDAEDGFIWTTSDSGILEISEGGESSLCSFTALKKGEVTVTVKSSVNDNVKDECKIEVVEVYRATDLEVFGLISDTVIKGASVALTAKVLPAEAADNPVSWTSSDEKTATITENGVLTAVETGRVKITASVYNGEFAPIVKEFDLKITEGNEYYEKFDDVYYSDGKTVKGSVEITATARSEAEDINLSVTDEDSEILADTRYALKVEKTGTEAGKWSFVDIKLPAVRNGEQYKLSFWHKFIAGNDNGQTIFFYGVLNPEGKLIFPDPARPGDYCGTDSWQIAKIGNQNTITVTANADYDYIIFRILGVTASGAENADYSYVLDDIKFNRVLTVKNGGSFGGEFTAFGADNFCMFTTEVTSSDEFINALGGVYCEEGSGTAWRGMSTRLYADAFSAGRYTFNAKVRNVSGRDIKLYIDMNFNGAASNTDKELGAIKDGETRSISYVYDLSETVAAENAFVQIRIFSMTEEGHYIEFGDVSLSREEKYEFSNLGTLGGEFTSVQGSNGAKLSKDFEDASTFKTPVARVKTEEGSSMWRGITLRRKDIEQTGTYTIKFKVVNRSDSAKNVYFDVAGANSNSNKELGSLGAGEAKEYSYTFTLEEIPAANVRFIQLHVFFITPDSGFDFELGDVTIDFEAK